MTSCCTSSWSRRLRAEFHWCAATAGLVSSATLITSALGGIGAGFLSDRIGRRRTLVLTILVYSIGSGGSALATGLATLMFWRSIVGFGLGGEWSAGAVLVAESWPPKHRAKAIALMQSGWAHRVHASRRQPPRSFCRASDGACCFSPDSFPRSSPSGSSAK